MKRITEKEKEKCRAGTMFYPSNINWMEEDLNANCEIKASNKKGVGLSGLIDWKSSSCHQREVCHIQDRVMTF